MHPKLLICVKKNFTNFRICCFLVVVNDYFRRIWPVFGLVENKCEYKNFVVVESVPSCGLFSDLTLKHFSLTFLDSIDYISSCVMAPKLRPTSKCYKVP